MKQLAKFIFLFAVGGSIYYTLEMTTRGFSHWSMYVLGGICFFLCGLINQVFGWEIPLWKQMFISAFMITVLEFIAGYILNVKLGLGIWDYSQQPLNIMGQVCLPFFIIWFFLSFPAIIIEDYLRYLVFQEEKPRYIWKLKRDAAKQNFE